MDLHDRPGWAIYDGRRRYIAVSFQTQGAAEEELRQLLLPYPPEHNWRKRLRVDAWPPPAKVDLGFDPPYGYRRQDDRHGCFLRIHSYEERVLRRLQSLKDSTDVEAARELNTQGFHTRERGKFTKDYVSKIRKEMKAA